MKYTNSIAVIRTKKENTVGCRTVSTRNYQKLMPDRFAYTGYVCECFEIYENVGGQVIIKTFDKLNHAEVEISNTITLDNVTEIEVLSVHDL